MKTGGFFIIGRTETAKHASSPFTPSRFELTVFFNDITIYRANRDFVVFFAGWLQEQFPKLNIRLDIRKPDMNFRRVIEYYGYPVISKEVSHAVNDAAF